MPEDGPDWSRNGRLQALSDTVVKAWAHSDLQHHVSRATVSLDVSLRRHVQAHMLACLLPSLLAYSQHTHRAIAPSTAELKEIYRHVHALAPCSKQ